MGLLAAKLASDKVHCWDKAPYYGFAVRVVLKQIQLTQSPLSLGTGTLSLPCRLIGIINLKRALTRAEVTEAKLLLPLLLPVG